MKWPVTPRASATRNTGNFPGNGSVQFAEQAALREAFNMSGRRPDLIPLGQPWTPNANDFGQSDISRVRNKVGLSSDIGEEITSPQGELNDLAQFYREYPNAVVQQLSSAITSVVCPFVGGNPRAYDLPLPDGATVFQLFANTDFFMSPLGAAEIPTLKANSTTGESLSRSVFKPVGIMFYCGGKRGVSVISLTDGGTVQALCYITNKRPTIQGS